MSESLGLIGIAVLGTLLSAVLALVPALHIYNVVGVLIVAASALSGVLNADQIALLLLGMVIGYAMFIVYTQYKLKSISLAKSAPTLHSS